MTNDIEREDEFDELLDSGDEPRTARERFRRKAQTEGLDTAYRALIEVLNDSKAPAPARATAGGLMLRAAGVFSKKFEEDGESEDGGLDGASLAELETMLKQLRAKDRKLERLSKSEKVDSGGRKTPGGSDGGALE